MKLLKSCLPVFLLICSYVTHAEDGSIKDSKAFKEAIEALKTVNDFDDEAKYQELMSKLEAAKIEAKKKKEEKQKVQKKKIAEAKKKECEKLLAGKSCREHKANSIPFQKCCMNGAITLLESETPEHAQWEESNNCFQMMKGPNGKQRSCDEIKGSRIWELCCVVNNGNNGDCRIKSGEHLASCDGHFYKRIDGRTNSPYGELRMDKSGRQYRATSDDGQEYGRDYIEGNDSADAAMGKNQ